MKPNSDSKTHVECNTPRKNKTFLIVKQSERVDWNIYLKTNSIWKKKIKQKHHVHVHVTVAIKMCRWTRVNVSHDRKEKNKIIIKISNL